MGDALGDVAHTTQGVDSYRTCHVLRVMTINIGQGRTSSIRVERTNWHREGKH
jgi:hypothetical protein